MSSPQHEGMDSPNDSSDSEDKDGAHEKLVSAILALDGSKRNKNVIRGLPVTSGNLDLVVHAHNDTAKIRREDLDLKARGVGKQLRKPMNSLETEKVKRQIAREALATEMSKWDPVVQEIRAAPQTVYSNRPYGIKMYEAVKPKPFMPRTPLEKELFEALGKSENILKPDQELTVAEAKALKAMSIKEARARRAELMKHHELLSRMELKAKRQKKIKSKRYRKILRKEKLMAEKKELEHLQKTDPEAFLEKIELMERARMEERLTLRHRGGGKFARIHKAYSKFDEKTREAVQDMLQRSRELTKKRQDVSSSEDDEEKDVNIFERRIDDEESGDEKTDATKAVNRARQLELLKEVNRKAGGWLDGPKTTYAYVQLKTDSKSVSSGKDQISSTTMTTSNIDFTDVGIDASGNTEIQKDKNNQLSNIVNSGAVNVSVFTSNTKKDRAYNDILHTATSEHEVEKVQNGNGFLETAEMSGGMSLSKQHTKLCQVIESDNRDFDEFEINTEVGKAASKRKASETMQSPEKGPSKKRKKRNKKKENVSTCANTEQEKAQVKEVTLQTPLDEDRNHSDISDDEMRVTMEELFQDEDVLEEFAKEKAEAEEKNHPKFEDTHLPGWGNWAGPDYKEQKRHEARKKRAQEKAKRLQGQQQKIKQHYVWINPNNGDSIRKFQPKKVPFPYSSVQQYESSTRQPVSRGFVRETAFKLLTKPEVVTKLGHIIKPLDKEDYFKDKEIEAHDVDSTFSKSKDALKYQNKKVQQKRHNVK